MSIQVLEVVAHELGSITMIIPFRDENGSAVTPDSATWSLSTPDGTIVNSRENIVLSGPTSDEEVVLSGNDLEILDGDEQETRHFTVKWTYGGSGRTATDECKFQIQNLVGVS